MDKDYQPHESWCDCMNNISELCNCMVSGYIGTIEEAEKVIQWYVTDEVGCPANQEAGSTWLKQYGKSK